ncbi:MAG: DUF3842 family protein [Gemmiger sp.]|nr:DUF3842 family protein [Gemmiger sp.]
MRKPLRLLVIDGQGGRIGQQLTEQLLAALPEAELVAVGTNAAATAAMRKGGATLAATGENAVLVNARRADVILGPVGIVIADALLGEITPAMATAVGQADAKLVLIPVSRCNHLVAGTQNLPVGECIRQAVELAVAFAGGRAVPC